jgi:hypothetical protein
MLRASPVFKESSRVPVDGAAQGKACDAFNDSTRQGAAIDIHKHVMSFTGHEH